MKFQRVVVICLVTLQSRISVCVSLARSFVFHNLNTSEFEPEVIWPLGGGVEPMKSAATDRKVDRSKLNYCEVISLLSLIFNSGHWKLPSGKGWGLD